MARIKSQDDRNPTLVDLSAQYRDLSMRLSELGGELNPETELELDALTDALIAKTDGYGMVIARMEAEAAFWKLQKEECYKAQSAIENTIERLKNRMKFALSQTESQSMQGELFRFFLSKGRDKLVIDEAVLSPAFKKTEMIQKPDRALIEASLKKGVEVDGVRVEPTQTLRRGRPQ